MLNLMPRIGVTQIWTWDLPLLHDDPPVRRTTRLDRVKIF